MSKRANIYKPKIGRINNNQKVYYSFLEDKLSTKNVNESLENVDEFLKRLENSGSYIFNRDVVIETFDSVYNTKIAGKIGSRIITLDNMSIDMKDIKNIY